VSEVIRSMPAGATASGGVPTCAVARRKASGRGPVLWSAAAGVHGIQTVQERDLARHREPGSRRRCQAARRWRGWPRRRRRRYRTRR
jgi:hypothetical protein